MKEIVSKIAKWVKGIKHKSVKTTPYAIDTRTKSPKGQLRKTKQKASGAAQLKRAAKKRNNIRKHG